MKVASLATLVCCFLFSARRNKAKESQSVPIPVSEPSPVKPAMSKAPDFDKPEQFLWYVMFGANVKYSCLFRFGAAVVFFGGQLALEMIKAMR